MNRRALLRRAAAVGTLAGMGGCLQRRSPATASGFDVAWTSDSGSRLQTVSNGRVFGLDSGVVALDADTGDTRWTYGETGGYSAYTALTVADAVYFGRGDDAVGSGNGELYALEFDGTERWTCETGSVYERPRVADGVVFAGSDDGVVRAVDAESGEVAWQTDLSHVRETPEAVDVVAVDDVVYATAGPLVGLDSADGSVVWRYGESDERVGRATVVDGTAYITSWDGVAAVGSGEERWRTAFGDGNKWVRGIEAQRVLVEANERLHAFDARDGTEQWATEPFERLHVATHDGVVFVAGERVAAFDAENGSVLWSTPVDADSPVRSLSVRGANHASDSPDDARLYARTERRVVAFDADGELLRSTRFDERVRSHLFDEQLYVGTDEATYALAPV